MVKIQNTKFSRFTNKLSISLGNSFIGPWKKRSLGLLSLLLGFYFGSNLTVLFQQTTNNRLLVVMSMILLIEIFVRLRSFYKKGNKPSILLISDNFRIGCIYSVVLEAFKLGS